MGDDPQGHAAMSAALEVITCPRCRARDIRQVAASPVPGRWIMRGCQTCWYVWRSTEPETATEADRYPESFRLETRDVTGAPRMV
jgi:vanillate/4-hydroxybenzoate decarboxylase subunit D